MPLTSHNNATQRVDSPGFSPLLRNESPYFNNLNRAPKNAYDYAEELNKILSLGGYVTKHAPGVSGTTFDIYEFVTITDSETILANPVSTTERVGIVVTSVTDDGFYWVCTFCPNFTFPSAASIGNFAITPNQEKVSLASTTPGSVTTKTLDALVLCLAGGQAIAKKIGPQTIFYCGSARIF